MKNGHPAVIKVQFCLPDSWSFQELCFLIKGHLKSKLVFSCSPMVLMLTTQSCNHMSHHFSAALRFIIPNFCTILSLPPKAMYQLVIASTGGSHPWMHVLFRCSLRLPAVYFAAIRARQPKLAAVKNTDLLFTPLTHGWVWERRDTYSMYANAVKVFLSLKKYVNIKTWSTESLIIATNGIMHPLKHYNLYTQHSYNYIWAFPTVFTVIFLFQHSTNCVNLSDKTSAAYFLYRGIVLTDSFFCVFFFFFFAKCFLFFIFEVTVKTFLCPCRLSFRSATRDSLW